MAKRAKGDRTSYSICVECNNDSLENSDLIKMFFNANNINIGTVTFNGNSYVINPLTESVSKSNPYRRLVFDMMMNGGIGSIFRNAAVKPSFNSGLAIGQDIDGTLLNSAKNQIINNNYQLLLPESKVKVLK